MLQPRIGDQELEFRVLVKEMEPRLRAFARVACSRAIDIDEAVQETFLVAWRRFEDLTLGIPVDKRFSWLCATLVGQVRNIERRERRHLRRLATLRNERQVSTGDHFGLSETRIAFERAVKTLEVEDRVVLLMSIWEDISVSEIAEFRNSSYEATKKHLQRLKSHVRAEMETRDA